MAESLGVYVPAMVLQKLISLGRVVLFTHLLTSDQYGLWGLGMMIFNIAGPLMTLGSNHGLIRYVSFYEARGQLVAFYRRMRLAVLVCAVSLAAGAFAASGGITRLFLASREGSTIPHSYQLYICWAALANALLGALYHNLLGFMNGMRAYRLVSAVELLFAVVFTAIGALAVGFMDTGLALLLAHLAALAVVLGAGLALLHVGVSRLAARPGKAPGPHEQAGAAVLSPAGETEEITGAVERPLEPIQTAPPAGLSGAFARVLRYGSGALLGTVLWNLTGYLSFWLTSYRLGEDQAGVFYVFLLVCQPVVFLANAAWAVIFTHVARLWERQQRAAMALLEAAYKAVVMATLTLTVAVYLTAPLWVRLVPPAYRHGVGLLGGLLMFFQVVNHLALMNMLAKLRERPVIVAVAAIVGGAANAALALWWMPQHEAVGAAWAAGIGMYAGAGAVAVAYLLATRTRLHPSTALVMLMPAGLLLPAWILAVFWAAALAVAAFTPLVFTPHQKRILVAAVGRAGRFLIRRGR